MTLADGGFAVLDAPPLSSLTTANEATAAITVAAQNHLLFRSAFDRFGMADVPFHV
jgi:hypothetical protein